MRLQGRGLLLLPVALVLIVLIMLTGRPVLATDPRLPSYSGRAQLEGPLQLEMAASPAVAQPGDDLSLTLTLTNHTNAPATPQISVAIPAGLSVDMRLLPSGTTYNVQANSLGWQPLVPAGGRSQLIINLHIDVANMAQPEQSITATLRDGSREESVSVAYWVGVAPQASITASPQQVAVGQPVQLLGQSVGSGPFAQQWNLGDGRTLNIENPIVTYALPGTYQVTLQVANPLTVATATTWVMVVPQPAAQFTLDDLTPGVNQPILFVSQSGGAPPLRYYWDFGDGAFAETAAPVHAYPAPGSYLVRLMIENEFGRSEVSLPLVVGSPPVADMVLDPATVSVGTAVTGLAFGDQSVIVYQWDMGDGRLLAGEQISHVYQRPGDFYVTMAAGNDYGNSLVSRWIHVEPGFFYLFLPLIYNSTATATAGGSTAGGSEGLVSGSTPIEVARFALTANPEIERLSQVEQLYWYINEARRLNNLPPLGYIYELSLAAQHHSGDMAAVPGVMHVGSDGSHPSGRLYRFGYRGGYAGEATAWGFAHAYEAVEFWVNSPPHRTIILGQAATDLGVGYSVDLNAANVWYWTAEFGSSWLPPVEEEILPTPTPAPGSGVITLLGPPSNVALATGTVLDLTWNWPLLLTADQQFVVYLINSFGEATPIGFASSPVEGTRYALRLAGDWTFPTGNYQWQVKLESRSGAGVVSESEVRPLTFLDRAIPTPVPSPTPLPLPSETPTPVPTAVPTDNATPTPLPISTPIPTDGPTATPTVTLEPPPPTESAPDVPTEEPLPVSTPIPTATPTNTPEPPPTATPPMQPTPTPP